MADIARYPLTRHLRGTPTLHVLNVRRGKVVHTGTAQSFFFRPLSAVLSEVPVEDRELAVLFHARTADFQDLAVQASVTFRVAEIIRVDGDRLCRVGRAQAKLAAAARMQKACMHGITITRQAMATVVV